MKSTAVLINTARSPIVEDTAIRQALTEEWIAGAAFDNIEEEPAKQRDWRPTTPALSASQRDHHTARRILLGGVDWYRAPDRSRRGRTCVDRASRPLARQCYRCLVQRRRSAT